MRKLTKEEITAKLAEPNGAEKLVLMNVDPDDLLKKAAEMFAADGAASALLLRLVNKKQYAIKLRENGEFVSAVIKNLSSESPKLRRNCARLIGAMKLEAETELMRALDNEEQRFVRPSMVLALGSLGTEKAREYLEKLGKL